MTGGRIADKDGTAADWFLAWGGSPVGMPIATAENTDKVSMMHENSRRMPDVRSIVPYR
jgi:hypothetical protein